MLVKSLSQIPKTPDQRARSCEEVIFQRFMAGVLKTRHDLYRDVATIALRSTQVGQIVAVSSTVKVLDTLLSGSWLH